MLLILLRHAEAVERAATDSARPLTPKGVEQAARVARFLRRGKLQPNVVLSSPAVRAKQTEVLVAEVLDREVVLDVALKPGMSPQAACEVIEKWSDAATVLFVGHEPDLSALAAHLLGLSSPEVLRIRKASLTGIELPHPTAGAGELQFFLPVRLMP